MLPPEVQAAHRHIPWARRINLRNWLIHAYDQVDLEIVARILILDVPGLMQKLDRVLSKKEG